MVLQASSVSFSGLSHQGISGGLNYVTTNGEWNSFSEQIIKTQDSALEILKLIENGTVSKSWELQKTQPSVTWLGNQMDKIFGWGKYHPETQKAAGVALEESQKRKISLGDCQSYDDFIIRNYIHTSYESQSYTNHSCAQLDTVNYWTEIFQVIFKPVEADDSICRIAACMWERLRACYPKCLPCLNATDAERNDMLNTTSDALIFKSDFDDKLLWVYGVQTQYQTNHSLLNNWKLKQIYTLFNTTRKDCENQVLHPKNAVNNVYYALLSIPIVISGGVCFLIYNRNKKREAYIPMEQSMDNL